MPVIHDPVKAPAGHIETKTTTCYMCACRCGIRVTLRNDAKHEIKVTKCAMKPRYADARTRSTAFRQILDQVDFADDSDDLTLIDRYRNIVLVKYRLYLAQRIVRFDLTFVRFGDFDHGIVGIDLTTEQTLQ